MHDVLEITCKTVKETDPFPGVINIASVSSSSGTGLRTVPTWPTNYSYII